MENTLHYLVMCLHSDFRKMLMENIKETELSSGQPKILEYLYYYDGAMQKDIAKLCHIEPATITSVLLGMEKSGLIERKMLNGNRRNLYVYLTEKGRSYSEKVVSVFSLIDESAQKNLNKGERESLEELLNKVLAGVADE